MKRIREEISQNYWVQCLSLSGQGCVDFQTRKDYGRKLTISRAPLITPHSTLLYHRPPSSASSGNSTNSTRGFSSRVSTKADPGPVGATEGLEDRWGVDAVLEPGGGAERWDIEGVMFRKVLKPTCRRTPTDSITARFKEYCNLLWLLPHRLL